MHAQNFVGVFICKHLDQPCSIAHGQTSTGGREWKRTSTVANTFFFQLLFCFTNPGNFGVGVDNPWNGVKMNMCSFTGNQFSNFGMEFIGVNTSWFLGEQGRQFTLD
jgi:hypothetical protein